MDGQSYAEYVRFRRDGSGSDVVEREQSDEARTGLGERGARYIKKSLSHLLEQRSEQVKFAFMQRHCTDFRVKKMAWMLRVSRSGYYCYVKAKPSDRNVSNQKLVEVIKHIHEASRKTYGSPRIHAELKAQGFECSKKRVARLMKENQIYAKMSKRFKKTTKRNPAHPVVENLLEQDFHALKPNEKWVSSWVVISLIAFPYYLSYVFLLLFSYVS